MNTNKGCQIVVINGPHNIGATGLKASPCFGDTLATGMCLLTRIQKEAGLLEGEAIKTKVGKVMATLIIITELPALLNGGHSSNAIKEIVIKNIAGNIVASTGDWRIPSHT